MNAFLRHTFGFVVVCSLIACGGDPETPDENNQTTVSDAGGDAAATDGGTTGDAGSEGADAAAQPNDFPDVGPPLPTPCAPDESPRLESAELSPNVFTTTDLTAGMATAELELEVFCFERPLESVSLATVEPRRSVEVDFEARADRLSADEIDVSSWLGDLPAGDYAVRLSVRGAGETLTESNQIRVTIEEQ